nr:hypothetical protein HK105_000589 [Polyrhizophydium stewartii]
MHLCFHSSILGMVASTIIPYSSIAGIERANAAFIIPNAILVTTKDGVEYFFASFNSRERAFALITSLWQSSSVMHLPAQSSSATLAAVSASLAQISTGSSGDLSSATTSFSDTPAQDDEDGKHVDSLHDLSTPPATSPVAKLASRVLAIEASTLITAILVLCFVLSLAMLVASLYMLFRIKSIVNRMDAAALDPLLLGSTLS